MAQDIKAYNKTCYACQTKQIKYYNYSRMYMAQTNDFDTNLP